MRQAEESKKERDKGHEIWKLYDEYVRKMNKKPKYLILGLESWYALKRDDAIFNAATTTTEKGLVSLVGMQIAILRDSQNESFIDVA